LNIAESRDYMYADVGPSTYCWVISERFRR
jgi:hypothetical protein